MKALRTKIIVSQMTFPGQVTAVVCVINLLCIICIARERRHVTIYMTRGFNLKKKMSHIHDFNINFLKVGILFVCHD